MKRDTMEFDIVGVGGGVATFATVLRLLKRIKQAAPAKAPSVLIVEKGAMTGAHILSGAVLDPEPLTELLSAEERSKMPIGARVKTENFYRLTRNQALRLPWIPPALSAHNFPIVSLSSLSKYLGQLCEEAGAEIGTGFSAAELLQTDGRVTGIRIGDKGIDKHGSPKPIFEPGPDISAKVVILGEGACGKLTEKLIAGKGLRARGNPQAYAIGIKEIYETQAVPGRAGTIAHTFGYPLAGHAYGGGFLYCPSDTKVAVGLVTALDYAEAALNPHDLFRLYKRHPLVHSFLADSKVIAYGAKVLPEGGFYSLPALASEGALIVGDAAGLLDSLRLKGIHIALQSGIAAGDTLFDCWQQNDFSLSALSAYPRRLQASSGWRQMKRIRNVRACFTLGTLPGIAGAALSLFTNGLLPPGRWRLEPDWQHLRRKGAARARPEAPGAAAIASGLQLDRLSDLFYSGTKHEENQPCHLKIIDTERCKECIPKFGAPCTLFCPAQVYTLASEGDRIQIDAGNCLHCKTCQIKDPLENIEWNLPEGGGGPNYVGM